MGCEPGKIHAHDERVTVQGKVLYVSKKAVKIWTPIRDEWFPFSEISPEDLARIGKAQEGETIKFQIPRWLAREKGLVK